MKPELLFIDPDYGLVHEWPDLMKGFIPPDEMDGATTNSGDVGGPSLDDIQWEK